jgi:hypothetical protein
MVTISPAKIADYKQSVHVTESTFVVFVPHLISGKHHRVGLHICEGNGNQYGTKTEPFRWPRFSPAQETPSISTISDNQHEGKKADSCSTPDIRKTSQSRVAYL